MGQAGSTLPPSNSPLAALEGDAASVTVPAPVLAAAALQGAAATQAAMAQGIVAATLAVGGGRVAGQRKAPATAGGSCSNGKSRMKALPDEGCFAGPALIKHMHAYA